MRFEMRPVPRQSRRTGRFTVGAGIGPMRHALRTGEQRDHRRQVADRRRPQPQPRRRAVGNPQSKPNFGLSNILHHIDIAEMTLIVERDRKTPRVRDHGLHPMFATQDRRLDPTGHRSRPKCHGRMRPPPGDGEGDPLPDPTACNRPTRSSGSNGASAGVTRMLRAPCAAPQRNPGQHPRSGPGRSGSVSAITGNPLPNRPGSPLALSASRATCGPSRASAMRQQAPPEQRQQRLVDAAHPPAEPAGQNDAEGKRLSRQCVQLSPRPKRKLSA